MYRGSHVAGLGADSPAPPSLVVRWFHVSASAWSQMDPGQRQSLTAQAQQQESGYQSSLSRAVASLQAKVVEAHQALGPIPALMDAVHAGLDAWLGTAQECGQEFSVEVNRIGQKVEEFGIEINDRVDRANEIVDEYLGLARTWKESDPFDFNIETRAPFPDDEYDYLEAAIETVRTRYAAAEKEAPSLITACKLALKAPCGPRKPCRQGFACVSGKCQSLYMSEGAAAPDKIKFPTFAKVTLTSRASASASSVPWAGVMAAAGVLVASGTFFWWLAKSSSA